LEKKNTRNKSARGFMDYGELTVGEASHLSAWKAKHLFEKETEEVPPLSPAGVMLRETIAGIDEAEERARTARDSRDSTMEIRSHPFGVWRCHDLGCAEEVMLAESDKYPVFLTRDDWMYVFGALTDQVAGLADWAAKQLTIPLANDFSDNAQYVVQEIEEQVKAIQQKIKWATIQWQVNHTPPVRC
jgi:hypothetical protein